MNQNEFNQFYDKLKRYANERARSMFHDTFLRQEAVDKCMDRVENWFIKGQRNKKKKKVTNIEGYCKTIINMTLINAHLRRKVEPVSLDGTPYNVWGFRGRKLKD